MLVDNTNTTSKKRQNRPLPVSGPTTPDGVHWDAETNQASPPPDADATSDQIEKEEVMSQVMVFRRNREMNEELHKVISHLYAQISLISGDGLENFCNHNDQIKSDYLWAITDTAKRALALIDSASDSR